MNDEPTIEYRVCWSASSNVTFRDATDWMEWDDPGESADDIEEALSRGPGGVSDGFEMALEGSGFEWWVETRPIGSGDE